MSSFGLTHSPKRRGCAARTSTDSILRTLRRFPLPPIEEQRRIAAILDHADELRAKRRASFALLDSLTESIFLDMFGDPAAAPSARWR